MQIAATPRRRAATSRRFVAVVSTGKAVQQRRFASWVAVVVAEERFLAGPVGVAWRRGGKWGGLVPRLRSSSNEPIGDQLLTSLVVLDILPLQISDETGIKLLSRAWPKALHRARNALHSHLACIDGAVRRSGFPHATLHTCRPAGTSCGTLKSSHLRLWQ
jgi:hypothetical protein